MIDIKLSDKRSREYLDKFNDFFVAVSMCDKRETRMVDDKRCRYSVKHSKLALVESIYDFTIYFGSAGLDSICLTLVEDNNGKFIKTKIEARCFDPRKPINRDELLKLVFESGIDKENMKTQFTDAGINKVELSLNEDVVFTDVLQSLYEGMIRGY
ncbi:gp493 [Bacillus phage G]|uniref:Gp493 n=1 Tax=Bacillus phage G TaxID=2884420 RepID=G3MAN4_9CAUD|nr:gp493 [Bacillus phage G]AEO93751.1 gp493 [Bacillus phage G]